MLIRALIIATVILALLPPPEAHAADTAAIAEVRAAWQACTDHLAAEPDNWHGWRRVHDGGYADLFEFWDQGADGYGPSILKRRYLIDAIASEEQTFCYRPDGTLAFVFTEMTSPDMLADGSLTREGRIYLDPAGQVIRVLGKLVGTGFETSLDDPAHQLARGCWELDLALTRDAAHLAYLHEMGDLDGIRPDYTPNPYDWCAAAE